MIEMKFVDVNRCPVCGHDETPGMSDNLVKCLEGEIYVTYNLCLQCGLMFQAQTLENWLEYYKHDYRANLNNGNGGVTEKQIRIQNARAVALVSAFDLDGYTNVLDIGSSTGALLGVLRSMGVYVTGVEPGIKYRDFQRERGVPCYDTIDDITVGSQFDLITMIHSLEHFADPAGMLKKVRKYAHNDTRLMIDVPNYQESQSALGFAHPVAFDPDSLLNCCCMAGWNVQKMHGWSGNTDTIQFLMVELTPGDMCMVLPEPIDYYERKQIIVDLFNLEVSCCK